MKDGFAYSLKEKIVINAPRATVYQYLKQAAQWPAYLPHVKNIEMLYEDNKYQEFYMDVLSKNGSLLKVRSIRKCADDYQIIFFQPEPPAFLKNHSGGWIFEELSPTKCHVTTYHRWNLADDLQGKTPEQVTTLLQEHARLALTRWQQVIEAKKKLLA